jgi:hypothetical protein
MGQVEHRIGNAVGKVAGTTAFMHELGTPYLPCSGTSALVVQTSYPGPHPMGH